MTISAFADLLPLPQPHHHTDQTKTYRVLTAALSDLGFCEGDILTMRTFRARDMLDPFGIVALEHEGRLLLRQFVPPRLLVTNSAHVTEPPLTLHEGTQVIATAPAIAMKRYLTKTDTKARI